MNTSIDYLQIIDKYYPININPLLRELLITHSRQVADFATELIQRRGLETIINVEFVYTAAMLHDIGIKETNAHAIHCFGTQHYMQHGLIGANFIRQFYTEAESFALVCERHIGTGLTAKEIATQQLPLPYRDYLPITLEEKLVCYADNFFSKSDTTKFATINDLRQKMIRYGEDCAKRLEEMIDIFGY